MIEEVIQNLYEKRARILDGKTNCIPCPFIRFREVWPGIERKKYYIVTGQQKSGKTQFTDYTFLYEPLKYAYRNPDKVRVKIFYFSLEMSAEEKLQQLISHLLYIKSKGATVVSPTDLRSTREDKPVEKEILDEISKPEYMNFMQFFEEHVTIISDIRNPTGIYKFMENYAKNSGTIFKKELEIVNSSTKERITQSVFSHYVPNDEDEYVICIVDHISLLSQETGLSLHETISKLSADYFVKLRNYYSFIPVVVQQQAIAGESDQNVKDNRLFPTVSNLAENKLTSRDANSMFGLYSPFRHNIAKHEGYDISVFRDNIRFMELMISRDGGAGSVCPLFFNGAVNYFAEMPRSDNKQELDKMYKLTDHYRKKIRVNLFNYFLKTKKRNGSISSCSRP